MITFYTLFIVINELKLIIVIAIAQRYMSSTKKLYRTINAKHFKYYVDCSVTLNPGKG